MIVFSGEGQRFLELQAPCLREDGRLEKENLDGPALRRGQEETYKGRVICTIPPFTRKHGRIRPDASRWLGFPF